MACGRRLADLGYRLILGSADTLCKAAAQSSAARARDSSMMRICSMMKAQQGACHASIDLSQGAFLVHSVQWTFHTLSTFVKHLCVNHRCGNIGMSQQLLHGTDVIASARSCVKRSFRGGSWASRSSGAAFCRYRRRHGATGNRGSAGAGSRTHFA